MQVFSTDIFRDFLCKGSNCNDNCCKIGWDIEIDEDTYNFYKSLDNDLGRKLTANIYEENGCHYMGQNDGCPFMNEKGLCSIQLAYGEDKISDICREHPRFYEWFGTYKESGVGICCEKTCEMLLEHTLPIEFFTAQTEEECDDLDFDENVLEIVLKARQKIFQILQDRNLSITQRLEFLKKSGEILQQGIDSGDVNLFYQCGEEVCSLDADFPDIGTDKKKFFCENVLKKLEKEEYMHNHLPAVIQKAILNSDKIINNEITEFPYIWEHLAVYFTFRYFIKAVRDFDFIDKTEFTLKSITAIYLILCEIQFEKGTLEKEDFIFAIKEYSKEIEYSDNDF